MMEVQERIEPHLLMARCEETPAGLILRRLCAFSPKYLTRDELLKEGGIVNWDGPISQYVRFANILIRINKDIRPMGWCVARESPPGTAHFQVIENYRLELIA